MTTLETHYRPMHSPAIGQWVSIDSESNQSTRLTPVSGGLGNGAGGLDGKGGDSGMESRVFLGFEGGKLSFEGADKKVLGGLLDTIRLWLALAFSYSSKAWFMV